GNPQQALNDKGVINNGFSRHMIRNISFLSDFKEINGGYVAFGENPKGGKISGKDTKCVVLSSDYKLPDENHVLLRVPRENNMYNLDLKNVVPLGDLICLFAKATLDEFNLCHMRLGYINFKTMNKLVKGNLVRGIMRKFSVARTPQQNEVADRKNRTLIEAARTMLADSFLPILFCVEAVNTACYVQNRVLVTNPHNKTPFELLHGRSPSVGFMRPFGCHVTILNTLDPLGNFDGKADEGFLVGYSVNSKAFKVFNSRTRIVQETLHINFLKNKPNVVGIGPKWLFDIDTLTKSMNYQPVVAGKQPNDHAGIKENLDAGKVRKETVSTQQYVLLPLWSTGSQNPHNTYDDAFDAKRDDKGKSTVDSPTGVRDLRAKFKEFSSNNTNRVNAVNAPVNAAGSNSTNSNMPELEDIVYSDDEEDVAPQTRNMTRMVKEQRGMHHINDDVNKKDERGIMIKNKARLVAQGHTQEEGIDYDEVFAPVERIKAIRLFLAYASFMGFTVYQMDVKSAFLYGTIEEEVYVCQPLGFEDPDYPDKVYKVVKALYGLHQAPRSWKFSFTDVKSASTPIETEKPLLKDPDGEDVDVYVYSYLKGKPHLGLWYPRDSPFNLVSYSDSEYARASLDRKSTTGGCQFLGCRLISWQCKSRLLLLLHQLRLNM
nr:ribonuclease H-like domain-containing protein [Tanacetum cinerariifolium]